jgi:hypothetical protein
MDRPALQKLLADVEATEITRFNAVRHGVLSRYTVLPWGDAAEYRDLVASFVVEHAPQGPTEEHLVEELAGILWRNEAAHAQRGGGVRPAARTLDNMARPAWGAPLRIGLRTCRPSSIEEFQIQTPDLPPPQ